ncbi:unnamed protein product [Sphagnum jensenii]|uniref:Uncharacterized protein n=1 Tax=Sphagnum jensenii TaxID=128206 RepID=A0ABP1BNW3_9BRYO
MPDPDLKGQLFSTTDETQMTDKNLLGNSTPKSSQYYNCRKSNLRDREFFWIAPVHDLNQQCTSSKPDLVVIFFHGIGLGKNDEWKETWMSINSDGKRVHWPQEWLPADLASKNGNNVQILSVSYESALLGVNENVTDIGNILEKSEGSCQIAFC